MRYTDTKVLIISHNPLSRVNNNGKTLASIFEGIPEENLYQIYLNADRPDTGRGCHYLQIHEGQMLRSVLHLRNLCCREVEATPGVVSANRVGGRQSPGHVKRLVREGLWGLSLWKAGLDRWLADKRFDVVFFMAGDGLFAYDVYRFVMARTAAKGCLFFTDDYVIGKPSRSPAAALRRGLLKRRIRRTLPLVRELYVISDEMREAYEALFGVRGYVIRNFSVERRETEAPRGDASDGLTIVYAGGLHYNRWQVLSQIGRALHQINQRSPVPGRLKVYSAQRLGDEIVASLSVEGACEFCGGVSAAEIADVYGGADILLHVESFDRKAMASTCYSFSTKIPEYLSAGRCVMAVGPASVASIRYLSGCACTVSDPADLPAQLERLLRDGDYRAAIRARCRARYERDFSPESREACLRRILSGE